MGNNLYFDWAATTPVREEVIKVMTPWLTDSWGNPSSVHSKGIKAHAAVENSREIIANMIGAEPSEIFFTSCGSEANTWALTRYKSDRGRIFTPIEHHSVMYSCLSDLRGATHCSIDSCGRINIGELRNLIKRSSAKLVTTQYVNNEIGTIEPVDQIAPICEREDLLYHVDAVQAFGHIPLYVKDPDHYGITTLSASAHKIGGPKGIGFLYIRKDVQRIYSPLIYGGKQEQDLRGGTENVAGIVGFAKACELAQEEVYSQKYEDLRSLVQYCWDFFKNNIPNAYLNGLPILDSERVPHILNVSFEKIKGEELASMLNEQGICVSTGSACNSGSSEPSHVLKALGISKDLANSSIRISFGPDTKLIDINYLCQKIVQDVAILRGDEIS